MLTELEWRMDEHSKKLNRDSECKKLSNRSHRAEEYNWLKIIPDGISNRIDEAEEQHISDLKDQTVELIQTEQQKEQINFKG